jgi:hypothetical protein
MLQNNHSQFNYIDNHKEQYTLFPFDVWMQASKLHETYERKFNSYTTEVYIAYVAPQLFMEIQLYAYEI